MPGRRSRRMRRGGGLRPPNPPTTGGKREIGASSGKRHGGDEDRHLTGAGVGPAGVDGGGAGGESLVVADPGEIAAVLEVALALRAEIGDRVEAGRRDARTGLETRCLVVGP